MLPQAFVTLLTDSSYLPGVLVVLYALRDLHPSPRHFKIVCLVTPETVDARAIGAVQNAGFDLVIGVEPIASSKADRRGLELMDRTDLNLALTKLHVFRLGSMFSKVIYLDADTLPIKPLSHLFETTDPHVLSACPDIGWPDCFNSGVMVIQPQESDFEGLLKTLRDETGNGSFDGADQGLLNQYFSEEGAGGPWNRLPFTYNVTPSAAYQYAPAYRYYADKISVLHFIGTGKPWQNLAARPAGATSQHSDPFGYGKLLDRWFSVYDRFVRPTAAYQPDLARRFEVPESISVWNEPQASRHNDGRMSLDELKAAILTGVASAKQDRYMSMPLEGRVDLMMPKDNSGGAHSQDDKDSGGRSPTVSPPVEEQELTVNIASPNCEGGPNSRPVWRTERHAEEGSSGGPTWDAARQPPPKHSRPEMIIPMTTVYAPAWDEPSRASASYFEGKEESAFDYPTLPQNVITNDWYGDLTTTAKPDPRMVSSVFPWETSGHSRPVASRRFPKDVSPGDGPEAASTSYVSRDGILAAAVGPQLTEEAPRGRSPSGSDVQLQSFVGTASDNIDKRPSLNFAESMALYTNAWDEVASIHSYAQRLTALGIGRERRAQATGLDTVAATPRGATSPAGSHRNSPPMRSPSFSSADGDDEEEGDGGLDVRVGRRGSKQQFPAYKDREAQTERLGVDAMVQTFTDPRAEIFPAGAGDLHPAAYGTPTSSLAQTSRPSHSRQLSRRRWDPNTDIALRRQDSEEVLQRFMKK